MNDQYKKYSCNKCSFQKPIPVKVSQKKADNEHILCNKCRNKKAQYIAPYLINKNKQSGMRDFKADIHLSTVIYLPIRDKYYDNSNKSLRKPEKQTQYPSKNNNRYQVPYEKAQLSYFKQRNPVFSNNYKQNTKCTQDIYNNAQSSQYQQYPNMPDLPQTIHEPYKSKYIQFQQSSQKYPILYSNHQNKQRLYNNQYLHNKQEPNDMQSNNESKQAYHYNSKQYKKSYIINCCDDCEQKIFRNKSANTQLRSPKQLMQTKRERVQLKLKEKIPGSHRSEINRKLSQKFEQNTNDGYKSSDQLKTQRHSAGYSNKNSCKNSELYLSKNQIFKLKSNEKQRQYYKNKINREIYHQLKAERRKNRYQLCDQRIQSNTNQILKDKLYKAKQKFILPTYQKQCKATQYFETQTAQRKRAKSAEMIFIQERIRQLKIENQRLKQ